MGDVTVSITPARLFAYQITVSDGTHSYTDWANTEKAARKTIARLTKQLRFIARETVRA